MAEEGALDAKVTTKVACAQRITTSHLYLTVLHPAQLRQYTMQRAPQRDLRHSSPVLRVVRIVFLPVDLVRILLIYMLPFFRLLPGL